VPAVSVRFDSDFGRRKRKVDTSDQVSGNDDVCTERRDREAWPSAGCARPWSQGHSLEPHESGRANPV